MFVKILLAVIFLTRNSLWAWPNNPFDYFRIQQQLDQEPVVVMDYRDDLEYSDQTKLEEDIKEKMLYNNWNEENTDYYDNIRDDLDDPISLSSRSAESRKHCVEISTPQAVKKTHYNDVIPKIVFHRKCHEAQKYVGSSNDQMIRKVCSTCQESTELFNIFEKLHNETCWKRKQIIVPVGCNC